MDVDNETGHIEVPAGYKLHTENSARLLLPDTNEAFLNPIQEFNRDLSIACIRVWAEEEEERKKSRWMRTQEHKAEQASKRRKGKGIKKIDDTSNCIAVVEDDPTNGDTGERSSEHETSKEVRKCVDINTRPTHVS